MGGTTITMAKAITMPSMIFESPDLPSQRRDLGKRRRNHLNLPRKLARDKNQQSAGHELRQSEDGSPCRIKIQPQRLIDGHLKRGRLRAAAKDKDDRKARGAQKKDKTGNARNAPKQAAAIQ